jgi:transcriptional regulator with XRE-family HTH domain
MTDPTRKQRFKRAMYDTRFDRFLVKHDVDLDELAALIGMSRENLSRIRKGRQNPKRDTIAAIVLALRHMLGFAVAASDLFYLGEERDDATPEAKEAKALLRVA